MLIPTGTVLLAVSVTLGCGSGLLAVLMAVAVSCGSSASSFGKLAERGGSLLNFSCGINGGSMDSAGDGRRCGGGRRNCGRHHMII